MLFFLTRLVRAIANAVPLKYLLPDGAQTHLFSGKLSRPLDSIVLPLSLQVDVQADAQAWDLIGQELVSRTRSLKLIFEHIDLALNGLVDKDTMANEVV